MHVLIIVNDPPYGTERAYNAFRLASALQKTNVKIFIFLMADAVACALKSQKTPNGYYNLERMLKAILSQGGAVKTCGGCMESRGIGRDQLMEGVKPSNMSELAEWVTSSDKTVTF